MNNDHLKPKNKMKIPNLLFVLTALLTVNVHAQDNLEQDRKAIKSLAGFYKVTFNYGEVASPNPDTNSVSLTAAMEMNGLRLLLTNPNELSSNIC